MLRVDAARAISKLRDYQLSEPTAWVLEGIRAAVASGATSVNLQGDSNDVWLSWTGEPWPSESLSTLLDELVSPASARDGQKLRLLGTAVNSALGLRPSYIDVFRIANGEAEKVRYLPDLIEEQEGEASSLERPALEAVAPPKRAGDACMFIHFRRRFGLEPLRNLFQGQPPEMRLARSSCVDLPIPMTIGNEEVGAHRNQSDLLRIDIGNDIDGFLALMSPSAAHYSGHAMMHVAEQGVHIASYAHDLAAGTMGVSPPIRLYINAERMPTNASRSEVRRNSHPISTAERQLPELFKKLCQAIVAELNEGASTEEVRRDHLRSAALGLLAGFVAGSGWSERARTLRHPFQQLCRLKLLRNALGQPRAVSAGWDRSMLYTGKEPLALDLAPWFRSVLWLADGDAAAVLRPDRVDASWVNIRLRQARRQVKARRRFESHAKQEARFDRIPSYWVRANLDASLPGSVSPPGKQRFEGEVYLWPRGRSATMTMLLDGREIEEVDLDRSPLPFRAIVAAVDLSPQADYKTVLRDEPYKAATAYVLCSAVRCVEAMCLDGAEGFSMKVASSSAELRALVHGAIETMCKLGLHVGTKSVLANHAAWEIVGGGWASLAELRSEAAVGCVTTQAQRTAAPPGRLTVVVKSGKRKFLRSLLEPETALVFYDPRRLGLYEAAASTLASGFIYGPNSVAALAIKDDDCEGAIAWGMASNELRVCHRMKRLGSYPANVTVLGATIAVDSDKVVPDAEWDGLRDDAGLATKDYSDWHRQLAQAYAMALIGRRPKEFVTNTEVSLSSAPGMRFVDATLNAEDMLALLGDTFEALRAAPLFHIMGGELVSVNDLAATFPASIDYVAAPPIVVEPDEDWRPLVADRRTAAFVGRLAGKPVNHALEKLARRGEVRKRNARLAVHRTKPRVKLSTILKHCSTVIEFKDQVAPGLIGIGVGPGQLDLHLLFEERLLLHAKIPSNLSIVAAFELDHSKVNADLELATPAVLGRLQREVLACAPRLLEARLDVESTALSTDWAFRAFLGRWLQSEGFESEEIGKIRDKVFFHDQRGQVLALTDAAEGAFLRISSYDAQPWTEASDGAEKNELDDPVIVVSEDAIVALIPILQDLLYDVVIVDKSIDMRKLQIARRIERGLLVSPRVPVDATLKRSLTDLIGSEMVGEIGFYDAPSSQVRIFEKGEEQKREELDLLPAVVVAIEDSELLAQGKRDWQSSNPSSHKWFLTDRSVALRARFEELAKRLLQAVLASKIDLPDWLRSQLINALCSGQLSVSEFDGLDSRAFFRTTRGDWVTWQRLEEQAAHFGNVWFVPDNELRVPYDPRRIAVNLPYSATPYPTDVIPWVDGRVDLSLDAVARENAGRPPVEELALSPQEAAAALTTIKLDGEDGVTGIVAPLLPEMAKARGVRAHLNMKVLGDVVDTCAWPTLAIINDSKISPNRSWSGPKLDERWEVIRKLIEKASDQALMKSMSPPKGTLTRYWVGRWVDARNPRYRKKGTTSVRGRLWLSGSTEAGVITIRRPGGDISHSPRASYRGMNFPLPIFGELLVYSTSTYSVDDVVSEVVELVYPQLLQQVAMLKRGDPGAKAAHQAIGLATGYAKAKASEKTEFTCFSPDPLSAAEVVALTQGDETVAMLDENAKPQPPKGLAFIRNNTELSRAFERLLAGRLINLEAPSEDLYEVDISDLEAGAFGVKAREGIHVLDALADDLHRRLVQLDLHTVFGYIRIAPEKSAPVLEFDHGELLMAGKSKTLRSLQAQRISGSTTHESCLDLLVAHAITILNQGLASVTDATEARALVNLMRLER
jgi:hypothetical protein